MSKASTIFNALPQKIRLATRPSTVEQIIVQLEIEKDHIRIHAKREILRLNNKIKSLRETVERDLVELAASSEGGE